MVSFPNAKINIGLYVTGKRADGFHNLQTVFYPVDCKDALEILPSPAQDKAVEFTTSGLTIAGDETDNLCIKAYKLLKKDYPQIPFIKLHLHKAIPMGAGLGGGSADAAFLLKLIDTKFRLNIGDDKLEAYALQLGSDCPFFITNKPAHATGRGEILERINLDLGEYFITLVNPGIHINTGWAFSQLTPKEPRYPLKESISRPVGEWKNLISNDFEAAVCNAHPAIGKIKADLYASGALYASMSGSGSTVYGIFDTPAPDLFEGTGYFVKNV